MKKVREDSQVCIDDLGKISQINKKLRKENEDLTMQVAEVAVLNAKIASAEEQIRSLQRSLSDDVNMQYQQKIAEKKYRKEIVALKNELDHLRKIPDSSNTSKFAAYEYSDLMLFISKLESENAALKFAVQSVENEMQQTSTTILELLHQKEDLKIATETASSASEAQQLAFQKSLDRLSELSAAYELIKEENRQLLTGMEQKEKSLQANREFFATNDITTSPSKKHLILSPLNSHRIDNDTSLDDSFVAEASEAVKNHQEKAGSYSSNPPLPSRRRSIPRFFKFGKSTFSGQSIMADDSMPSVGGKIYWHKSHDHRRSGVPSKGSQKLKTPLQSAEQQRLAVKTGDSSHGLNSGKSTIGISNSGSADGSQSDTGLIVKPKVLVASHKTTKKFVPPKDKVNDILIYNQLF